MTKNETTLLMHLCDNVWASVEHVHDLGYEAEANRLVEQGRIERMYSETYGVEIYIMPSKKTA